MAMSAIRVDHEKRTETSWPMRDMTVQLRALNCTSKLSLTDIYWVP